MPFTINTQRYVVRDIRGNAVAVHVRRETSAGKQMFWQLPDGTLGLKGVRAADLPLFGSEQLASWDRSRPVIVTEGEKKALTLRNAGFGALGTVTGAAGCPARDALSVLAGYEVVLWADNDDAGVSHMLRVATLLRKPIQLVASIGWISWGAAPPRGDAEDAIEAGIEIADLVAAAGIPPWPDTHRDVYRWQRRRKPKGRVASSPIRTFNAQVPVSVVLRQVYGLMVRPGQTTCCLFHEDRHASLSVLPDDRRVFCHRPGCWANNAGRGRDAWDLAHAPTDR